MPENCVELESHCEGGLNLPEANLKTTSLLLLLVALGVVEHDIKNSKFCLQEEDMFVPPLPPN